VRERTYQSLLWSLLFGAVVVLALILFIRQYSQTMDILAEDQAEGDGVVKAITRLLSTSAGMLILLLILAARVTGWLQGKHEDNPGNEALPVPKSVLWGWGTGLIACLIITVGLIVFVDPRGLYGTDYYEPRLTLVRGFKVNAYTALSDTPDIVVMGSSRAFTLSPSYIQDTLDYSAFNMSAEGARMEDYLVQTRFILSQDKDSPPKVLFIEVLPSLGTVQDSVAQRSPLKLVPYMEFDTARLAIELRTEGLFELQQLAEAIYVVRIYHLDGEIPRTWSFQPDGEGTRPPQPRWETIIANQIQRLSPPVCQTLDKEGIRFFEEIVSLAEKHDIALILYTSPRQPDYYNAVMRDNKRYLRCQDLWLSYMQDMHKEHEIVFSLNFSLLDSINGLAGPEGYYDIHHITVLNSNRLIEAAADTIDQAYAIATMRRSAPQEKLQQ
jgi:hypothetical protein